MPEFVSTCYRLKATGLTVVVLLDLFKTKLFSSISYYISLHFFYQQVINGLRRIGHNITMSANAGSTVQGILQLEECMITANADYRENGVIDIKNLQSPYDTNNAILIC